MILGSLVWANLCTSTVVKFSFHLSHFSLHEMTIHDIHTPTSDGSFGPCQLFCYLTGGHFLDTNLTRLSQQINYISYTHMQNV